MYSGNANKNIGDAFLLVWKICEGDDITKVMLMRDTKVILSGP
jgi:hypothetical protein